MFIVIAISLFAFAAVLAWCFYAESCIKFLSDSKFLLLSYKLTFVISAFIGAIISKGVAWELADIFNALMIFPNLALLITTRKEINKSSATHLLNYKRIKNKSKNGRIGYFNELSQPKYQRSH